MFYIKKLYKIEGKGGYLGHTDSAMPMPYESPLPIGLQWSCGTIAALQW